MEKMEKRFKNLDEAIKAGQEFAEDICNFFDINNKTQMRILLDLLNSAYDLGRSEAGRKNIIDTKNVKLMSLKFYLDDACANCGSGNQRVVEYVQSHDNNSGVLYYAAIKLDESRRDKLIDILLTSDYNIFVPWYKKLLINTNTYTSKEILMLYKEEFDKVPNMEDFD